MSDAQASTTILLWNIQGAGKDRCPHIATRIREANPDLIVLNEVQTRRTDPLLAELQSEQEGLSWKYCVSSNPPDKIGGVAVLAREELRDRRDQVVLGPARYRYLPVEIASTSLFLWAVYAPFNEGCDEFWQPLHAALRADAQHTTVLMGDLNAGLKGDTPEKTHLAGNTYVRELEEIGYIDLWRASNSGREPEATWYSRSANAPFCIDHAFGTHTAARRVAGVTYKHDWRVPGLSDHSAVLLTLRNS